MSRLRMREVVAAVHGELSAAEALEHIGELGALDRYQASRGIERAADRVAALAEAAGLRGVAVHRFPADGQRRWWTFRAPRSWTPTAAELVVVHPGGRRCRVTSYPDTPCSLAIHSAPTPGEAWTGELRELRETSPDASLRGCLAVLSSPARLDKAIARAERLGAAGFIAAVAPGDGEAASRVGRIELDPESRVFGFSVSGSGMSELLAAAREGCRARAVVEVQRTAAMPIVEGCLPGDGADEILLVAHLCHPRPGANDNLSGVAALLGIAKALHRLSRRTGFPHRGAGIRFLWGPEFVGTAAYLHDLVGSGARPMPRWVLNLDMVGEDQALCGGPLIVERSPDHLPSLLDAVVERCVELLPQRHRSYSGAVPADTWAWRSTPFVGASDHALFADRSIARPALMLGHWPDVFNHSSEDRIDKVDAEELRRAATVAGSAALLLTVPGFGLAAQAEGLVARWGARRLLEVARDGAEAAAARPGFLDPWSREELHGLLRHTADVATQAVKAAGGESRRVGRWLRRQASEHACLLDAPPAGRAACGPLLRRRWPGPFNLRALGEDAGPAGAAWLGDCLATDRGAYGLLVALALAVDGRSDRLAVIRRAAYAARLPIELQSAQAFFDLLERAGWTTEASSRPARRRIA
jgi:hypothetical protein